jgi:hypothetical protein
MLKKYKQTCSLVVNSEPIRISGVGGVDIHGGGGGGGGGGAQLKLASTEAEAGRKNMKSRATRVRESGEKRQNLWASA